MSEFENTVMLYPYYLLNRLSTGAQETVDKAVVAAVFPYGRTVIEVVEGGLCASSGIAISALGTCLLQLLIPYVDAEQGFLRCAG